jgi:hypothetical protein
MHLVLAGNPHTHLFLLLMSWSLGLKMKIGATPFFCKRLIKLFKLKHRQPDRLCSLRHQAGGGTQQGISFDL